MGKYIIELTKTKVDFESGDFGIYFIDSKSMISLISYILKSIKITTGLETEEIIENIIKKYKATKELEAINKELGASYTDIAQYIRDYGLRNLLRYVINVGDINKLLKNLDTSFGKIENSQCVYYVAPHYYSPEYMNDLYNDENFYVLETFSIDGTYKSGLGELNIRNEADFLHYLKTFFMRSGESFRDFVLIEDDDNKHLAINKIQKIQKID